MHTHYPNHTRIVRRSAIAHAERILAATDTHTGYCQLLDLARTLPGMASEVDHLLRQVAETEGDLGDAFDEAATDGYTPDDIEAAMSRVLAIRAHRAAMGAPA